MTILILCGGRSAEHTVSLESAKHVVKAIENLKHFNVLIIGIDHDGCFQQLTTADLMSTCLNKPLKLPHKPVHFELNTGRCLIKNDKNQILGQPDLTFPILHGIYGEDGCIQGWLETLSLPYLGAGVFASAAGMDKEITRFLAQKYAVPSTPFQQASPESLQKWQNFPAFVKPARYGSSIGVTQVFTREQLNSAVQTAKEHDDKVLIEQKIVGREIEVAVLETKTELIASPAGEIVPQNDFYSYEDKYLNKDGAKLIAPTSLSDPILQQLQDYAKDIFRAIDCRDLARVDFFLTPDDKVIFNEINTMPGFTEISMYPKLMALAGFPYPKLIQQLIENVNYRRKPSNF